MWHRLDKSTDWNYIAQVSLAMTYAFNFSSVSDSKLIAVIGYTSSTLPAAAVCLVDAFVDLTPLRVRNVEEPTPTI